MDEAKKVYDNEDASQETVDNASKALTDAQNALVRVTPTPVDKAELGKAISDAESLVEDETYTVASRKNLKAALDEVKAVYENADATQEDVDAAAAKLNKAIAGLQKKPNHRSQRPDWLDSAAASGARLGHAGNLPVQRRFQGGLVLQQRPFGVVQRSDRRRNSKRI